MAGKVPHKKTMTDEVRLAKNARIKATGKATRARRKTMICKVRDIKITTNHLSATQKEQLQRLFLEAKWLRNSIIGSSRFDRDYLTELGGSVPVRITDGVFEDREFIVLGGQAKQSVLAEVKVNLRTLASLKKKGKKVGALKFTREVKSLDLQQSGVSYKVDVDRNRVKVQNIRGWMRVRGLKQLHPGSELSNAKLVVKPDGYHLMVTTYTPPKQATGRQTQDFQIGTEIGIDMGVKTHLTLSNGVKIDATFEETDRLRRLRRKLARQIKGSANWQKTKHQIRVETQKIVRRKDDAANKITRELLKNERVYLQDEQLASWKTRKGWVRGGKRVHASILGRIKQNLTNHNRSIVVKKMVATTATCVCGVKTKHEVEKRTFHCPSCGYTKDRDIHAAENMIRLGKAQNSPHPEQMRTPAETSVRPPAQMDLKPICAGGNLSMKQEAVTSSALP